MTKLQARKACEAAEEVRDKASQERQKVLSRLAYAYQPVDFARYDVAHQAFVAADIAASRARGQYWQTQ